MINRYQVQRGHRWSDLSTRGQRHHTVRLFSITPTQHTNTSCRPATRHINMRLQKATCVPGKLFAEGRPVPTRGRSKVNALVTVTPRGPHARTPTGRTGQASHQQRRGRPHRTLSHIEQRAVKSATPARASRQLQATRASRSINGLTPQATGGRCAPFRQRMGLRE